ncbi:hypothetical protein DdX_18513 [Ditylenchus destructor]|uniref:Uncharacterized protein n=1 Tax=Ditylenchus destructor TaxID=166010 RepID=A0AAD4QUU5_9BILA|nr:hypothetical protein DdX_18513 [Ditylenchus destructor]
MHSQEPSIEYHYGNNIILQNVDPAQIPCFNSARDQEEQMGSLTSTAADLTNRIHVSGPCLHPTEENPRDHQREDLWTYFGQFGKIMNIKSLEQNLPEESESGPLYWSNLPEGVTNRIIVCGPCLHPEQVDPRVGQNGDLRAYFDQFGAIVNVSEEPVLNPSETHQGTTNAQSRTIEGTPLWKQYRLGSANVEESQIPRFNSIRDHEEQIPRLTSIAANLTNRIDVSGPWLHPEELDPKAFQKKEFRAYFGQFGNISCKKELHTYFGQFGIVNVVCYSLQQLETKVSFDNCDSATKCIQQGTHTICNQDFVVRAATPTQGMKDKIRANLRQNTSNGHVDLSVFPACWLLQQGSTQGVTLKFLSAANVQSDPPAESNLGNQWYQGLPKAIEAIIAQNIARTNHSTASSSSQFQGSVTDSGTNSRKWSRARYKELRDRIQVYRSVDSNRVL